MERGLSGLGGEWRMRARDACSVDDWWRRQ